MTNGLKCRRTMPWLALSAVVAASSAALAEEPRQVGPFTRIAGNATYGCRRPHGFGLYDPTVETTFVCWNGGGMSIFGRAYHHPTGVWSPIKEIVRLEHVSRWDYHNYPNLAQAPDGRLLITWATHGRRLHLARAAAPHDLTGNWEHRVISDHLAGYPMLVRHDQTVFIFSIANGDLKWPYRPFGYVVSHDNGETWSEQTRAIDSEQLDPDRIDEIYADHFVVVPASDDKPTRIQFTWVMRGGPKGHNQGSRNAFLASFLPDTLTWQAPDGTDLGEWIDYREMMAHCVVCDTGPVLDGRAISHTISSYQANGSPLMLYVLRGIAHQAAWRDGQWVREALDRVDVRGLQRQPDGSHRLLVAAPSQPHLEIRRQPPGGGPWELVSRHPIPYEDGANRTWSIGFIDQGRPEVDVLLSQLDNTCETSDYSGRWPVWVLSTAGD